MLSEGQTYQLRVAIQSQTQEPSGGSFGFTHLTDGRDVDTAGFAVDLDCDSLRSEPAGLEFNVGARQAQTVTKTSQVTADKVGTHRE